MLLFISTQVLGQNFKKVSPDILLDEGTVNQTKLSSYIYLKNEQNHSIIKNDIYAFFDSQISLSKNDYNPEINPTTTYMFYRYKKTTVLNENFIFNINANPDNNPMIYGHNMDLIAIVSYELIGASKSVDFYSNTTLVKQYENNTERTITNFDIEMANYFFVD